MYDLCKPLYSFVELKVKCTSCHSNRSSCFLLFIVDCNNFDNHKKKKGKKGATLLLMSPYSTSLCHNGVYQLLEADAQEYFHWIVLQIQVRETFLC